MRKFVLTLTAFNKRGSVKIGTFPFDGDKRKDRQPSVQVFAPIVHQVFLVHADCVSRVCGRLFYI